MANREPDSFSPLVSRWKRIYWWYWWYLSWFQVSKN